MHGPELGPIRQLDRDDVALAHAKLGEAPGDLPRLEIEPGEADSSPIGRDDCGRLGGGGYGCIEVVKQGAVRPPAFAAVATRHFFPEYGVELHDFLT